MNIAELCQRVIDNLESHGASAIMTLIINGHSRGQRRRLCPGGPFGTVVGEKGAADIVQFECMDMSACLTAKGHLRATIIQKDGVPGGIIQFVNTEVEP